MKWRPKTKVPTQKGWYITRDDEGHIQWRAWGNGNWWKQITGGWVGFFKGDGTIQTYEWADKIRLSVKLESCELPDPEKLLLKK